MIRESLGGATLHVFSIDVLLYVMHDIVNCVLLHLVSLCFAICVC